MHSTARFSSIVLGVWLVASAFVWPHSMAQQTNAWVVGILSVAFALLAAGRDELRYLVTALSVWLFASIWVLPSIRVATLWNSGIVAAGLFIFSLIPNLRTGTTRPMGRVGRPIESPSS
jgi:hypothetical protein